MEADGDLWAAVGPSAFLPACYRAPRCILMCVASFFQAVTFQPLLFAEAPLLRL